MQEHVCLQLAAERLILGGVVDQTWLVLRLAAGQRAEGEVREKRGGWVILLPHPPQLGLWFLPPSPFSPSFHSVLLGCIELQVRRFMKDIEGFPLHRRLCVCDPVCVCVCVWGSVSGASGEKEESQTADHPCTHPNMHTHTFTKTCMYTYRIV